MRSSASERGSEAWFSTGDPRTSSPMVDAAAVEVNDAESREELEVAALTTADAGGTMPVASGGPSAQTFPEMATRMVDLRGLGRPPTFGGKESEWQEFRFKLESLGSLLGLERAMQVRDGSLLPAEDRVKSHFLYNLLVQICEGRALLLIRNVRNADGCCAWQRLVTEYDPDVPSRHCAVLSALLTPLWKVELPFLDQLYAWEEAVAQW